MPLFSKITSFASEESKKLPNRFIQGGFTKMGAITRTPRTNTPEELLGSIQAYAHENPEIADFASQIKNMHSEHLGLAHDIIDLSRTHEMINTNINLNQPTTTGKSIAGYILGKLPEVSRENPAILNLIESVINHSDNQNSKYFLCKIFGYDLAKAKSVSEQIKATQELVPEIADGTLGGGYTMDYSKNENFFKYILRLCSSDSKLPNLKMLKEAMNITDNFDKIESNLNLDDIRLGDTAVIKKNLEALPYLMENAEAQGIKTVDVSGFLTRNTNIE